MKGSELMKSSQENVDQSMFHQLPFGCDRLKSHFQFWRYLGLEGTSTEKGSLILTGLRSTESPISALGQGLRRFISKEKITLRSQPHGVDKLSAKF